MVLAEIVQPRIEEILELARTEMERSVPRDDSSGVVVTAAR